MSALSKMSSSRAQPGSASLAYSDLRDKVAALVRPERSAQAASIPQAAPAMASLQLRSIHTEKTAVPENNIGNFEAVGRDLNSAFDILGRATTCFELLTQKLEQVESERDEAFVQIEEHKQTAAGWKEMIDTVRERLQDAERDLASMRQEIAAQNERANAAEQRAMQLEGTLRLRERRLGELDKDYSSLHDQVMSSFGLQSPTYRALETLVERFQAKAA